MQVQLLNELRGFHCDCDARSVIDRARSQVPGIQMPRDDDHLLRMFGSFEVSHDVIAQHVRPGLRSQREVQAHLALSGEMSNEVSVFAGYGACRDARCRAPSGMRQAVIGAADGTHQRSDRAQFCRGFRTAAAVSHGFPVGLAREATGGFLPVERDIEQNDFSCNLLPPQIF